MYAAIKCLNAVHLVGRNLRLLEKPCFENNQTFQPYETILFGCLMTAAAAPFFAQPTDSIDLSSEMPEVRGFRDIAGGVRFHFFDFDRMNHTLEQAGLPDAEPVAQGGFVAFRLMHRKAAGQPKRQYGVFMVGFGAQLGQQFGGVVSGLQHQFAHIV